MINLTPHDVVVEGLDKSRHTFPASGLVARVAVTTQPVEDADDLGVPIVAVEYGEAVLPSVCSAYDGPYIVSTLFADAYRRQGGQARLYVPDSGPSAIRKDGQIVAVRALIRR